MLASERLSSIVVYTPTRKQPCRLDWEGRDLSTPSRSIDSMAGKTMVSPAHLRPDGVGRGVPRTRPVAGAERVKTERIRMAEAATERRNGDG